MTKEQEFLYIVQMAVIGNAINFSTQDESVRDTNRVHFSSSGFFDLARQAIRCSKQIPPELNAVDAANEFIIYFLENQDDSKDGETQCPYWCLTR